MGHTTAIAGSGQEALEVLAGGEAFDLVILDQNMPGLSGTRTLERIRERWPELPVIIGTGYLEAPSAARIAGTKHVLVLQKPYSAMELRLAIERVLGST
jgi:CheY-like chemotaxis protein